MIANNSTVFFMNIKFSMITFIMLSSLVALLAITYAVSQHYKRHHQSMPGSLVLASSAGFVCDLAVSFMAYILPFQSLSKIHNTIEVISTAYTGIFNILADIVGGISLIVIASAIFILLHGVDKYSLHKHTQSHRKLSIILLVAIGMFILGGLGDTIGHSVFVNTANEYNMESEYHRDKHYHKQINTLHHITPQDQQARQAIIHYNGMNNNKFIHNMNNIMPNPFK